MPTSTNVLSVEFSMGTQELDLDYEFVGKIKELLEEVGFEVVEEKHLDIPIGEWPEESGMYTHMYIYINIECVFFSI